MVVAAFGEPAWAIVDAVRQYDENIVQTNVVDVSATALTAPVITTNVANAFDAGFGGVVNFDNGSFTDTRTIDVRFAGTTKLLRLVNTARDWSIGVLGTNSSSGAISGGNVCFNGAPTPFPNPYMNDFAFDYVRDANTNAVLNEHVTSFGFTIIDSTFNGSGNNLQFQTFYSDGSSESLNYTIPLAGNSQDTFFGWTAPAGYYITHILFSANNNTASDDWAFITSNVPEPGLGAGVCAALVLLPGARRSRK
jgi:hypothetical protein